MNRGICEEADTDGPAVHIEFAQAVPLRVNDTNKHFRDDHFIGAIQLELPVGPVPPGYMMIRVTARFDRCVQKDLERNRRPYDLIKAMADIVEELPWLLLTIKIVGSKGRETLRSVMG